MHPQNNTLSSLTNIATSIRERPPQSASAKECAKSIRCHRDANLQQPCDYKAKKSASIRPIRVAYRKLIS